MDKLIKLGPGVVIGLILGVLIAERISFGDTAYRGSPGYLAVTLVTAFLCTALYAFVVKPLLARLLGGPNDPPPGGDGDGA